VNGGRGSQRSADDAAPVEGLRLWRPSGEANSAPSKFPAGPRILLILVAMAIATFKVSPGYADSSSDAIRLLKARLDATDAEVRSLRVRLKHFESKGAAAFRKQNDAGRPARAQGAAAAKTQEPDKAFLGSAPLPFFINPSRGLMIESTDHANSFRIGGRLYIDGGVSTQPETGSSSLANLRQARLEVEGRLLQYWNYRLQYEFTSANTSAGAIGGIRDAFVAQSYFDPVIFQVGQFFEPWGLERTNSSKYSDFLEKSLPTEAFGPGHQIGAAVMTTGSNWSVKGGLFSTSLLDKSLAPAAGTLVPYWAPSQAGWVATGGSQYFDVTGRATYAPIKEEDRLLHIGFSGRYHRPNDSTAANDNRVMLLGGNTYAESNVLKENLLGTPDLSCGAVAIAGSPPVAGKCVRDVISYGAELVGSYGPFSLQAEYMSAHYDRDAGSVLEANTLGYYAPGGSSLNFKGYYVYGTWYLTGESRADAYQVKNLNPASFGQIKIQRPLSSGGVGAWEFAARFDALNLNNGPYSGTNFANYIGLAPNAATRAYVANTSVVGGREEDMTLGLNWYPETGIRVMANWTRVMQLAAPWDRAYLNNAHPNTFLMRTQIDW